MSKCSSRKCEQHQTNEWVCSSYVSAYAYVPGVLTCLCLCYAYACAYALMITSLQSLICFNSKQIKSDHSLESLCSTCICFHNLVAVTFFLYKRFATMRSYDIMLHRFCSMLKSFQQRLTSFRTVLGESDN